jgi:hypothetical protein
MMLAVFDPTLQAILWTIAVVSYVAAAVASARAHAVTPLAVGLIALGLALWHFPALWDLWGTV